MINADTKYVRVKDWGKSCSTYARFFEENSAWIQVSWCARYAYGCSYGDAENPQNLTKEGVVYRVLYTRDNVALITEAIYNSAPTYLVEFEGLEDAGVTTDIADDYTWFDALNKFDPEKIYRMVWFNHTVEDIKSFIKDNSYVLTDKQIERVAERYVYGGKYDCNLSYWDNIKSLVDDVLRSDKEDNN